MTRSKDSTKFSSIVNRRETGLKQTVSDEGSSTSNELRKKEQARWSRILRVYGLTREQYEELDEGHCPICLRDWSSDVRPVVDHDHKTGIVRGLLCFYCNHRIVGRHRDYTVIQRVADYLREAVQRTHKVPPKKKKLRVRKKKID